MIRFDRGAMWIGAAALSLSLLTAAVSAPAFAQAQSTTSQPAQEITPDRLALARKYVDLTDKVDIFGTTVAETGEASPGWAGTMPSISTTGRAVAKRAAASSTGTASMAVLRFSRAARAFKKRVLP